MLELVKENFIARWKKYFADSDLPLAFFFSNELQGAEPARKYSGHHCMIADLTKISKGQSLAYHKENIGCKGGMRYCGYTQEMFTDFEFFLSYGIPGKLKGERYKKDPDIVKEMVKNEDKIVPPAEWLIVKPFDQLGPDDNPEALIFLATHDVLAGLFTLANYDRSDLYGVKSPFCAGCGAVYKFPYLENQRENPDCILGLFDASARPYLPAGVLSFTIPMKRFEKIVGYMDESFLITDTWEVMRKRISRQN